MSAQPVETLFGSNDAEAKFSELLERAESGNEITITRDGTPVAKLVPVKRRVTAEQRGAAIEKWIAASRKISLGNLKFRDLINEGRP